MEKKISEICDTCTKYFTCNKRQENKQPILSCDEYIKLNANLDTNHIKNENHDFSRDKGLCTNCTKRIECTLNRPEGGVWHCNEYN